MLSIETLLLLLIGCVYVCGMVSGYGLYMLLTYKNEE